MDEASAASDLPEPVDEPNISPAAAIIKRLLFGLGVSLLVALIVWYVVAMPARDMSGGAPSTARGSIAGRVVSLPPDAFGRLRSSSDAFVINVHVPYEGELEGTDAFIPFDAISGDPRLPADRNSRLLVYCKSGRMSAIAGAALIASGYTNVTELAGGMEAWVAAGEQIIHRNQ